MVPSGHSFHSASRASPQQPGRGTEIRNLTPSRAASVQECPQTSVEGSCCQTQCWCQLVIRKIETRGCDGLRARHFLSSAHNVCRHQKRQMDTEGGGHGPARHWFQYFQGQERWSPNAWLAVPALRERTRACKHPRASEKDLPPWINLESSLHPCRGSAKASQRKEKMGEEIV